MAEYICTQCGIRVDDDDDPRHTCPPKQTGKADF